MAHILAQHHICVVESPQWAEIYRNFGPLFNLTRFGRRPVATHSTSGEDECSPVSSPVASNEELKMAALMVPVPLDLTCALSEEELSHCRAFLHRNALREIAEQQYTALIFKEYRQRKSIEVKWREGVAAAEADLIAQRQRELTPEARAALAAMEAGERDARATMTAAYDQFLAWVGTSTPQWLEMVRLQVEERLRRERAREEAMAAAKVALAEELANEKVLAKSLVTSGPRGVGTPYEHNSFDAGNDIDNGSAELTPSALRRKAIKMLEAEEHQVMGRREEQLRKLKAEEERIRTQLGSNALLREAEEERQRSDAMAQRLAALASQEAQVRTRLDEHSAAKRQQEEQRREMMEHIAAEEAILRGRLADEDAKRKALVEEAVRQEQQRKAALYDRVCEEEEQLRQRLRDREVSRERLKAEEEAEKQRAREQTLLKQRELEMREQDRARVASEQEAALQAAREASTRAEREQQLAYLAEQEAIYKSKLREKELTEIRTRAERDSSQHQFHSSPYLAHPPLPPQPQGHPRASGIQPFSVQPVTAPSVAPLAPVYYTASPGVHVSLPPVQSPSYLPYQSAAGYHVPTQALAPASYAGYQVPAGSMPTAPAFLHSAGLYVTPPTYPTGAYY